MIDPQDGTFSKLMEIAESVPEPKASKPAAARPAPIEVPATAAAPADRPDDDISTVPYMSQNYRFTEDELRWLRRSAFDFSEQTGIKVSQNTILRVALRELRDACERNVNSNPLTRAIARLKK